MQSEGKQNDTICAIATPQGVGAIAMIRVSGHSAINICQSLITPVKRNLSLANAQPNTIFLANIKKDDFIIDEVLISMFHAPYSYTGEEMIEISCHGSIYIQQEIIKLLINSGIRLATPGEFTMRAFLNGKLNLVKAEAIADLISSNSKASHSVAINQMRSGFTNKIELLREQFVDFASLIELELDFSEEDVEFADRNKFSELLKNIKTEVITLLNSFDTGNALKNGIQIAIVGKPNVGKSTLLNAILNEDRAIVSEIPGTTRDTIEDTINIRGINLRFIDTAGIRTSDDPIESIGIERTFDTLRKATIVLYITDISTQSIEDIQADIEEIRQKINGQRIIILANKTDLLNELPHHITEILAGDVIFISAKRKENINVLINKLFETIELQNIEDDTIITNARHYEALKQTFNAINQIENGLQTNVPTDLIAVDIKNAIQHLGEITGKIYTQEILNNIFGKFCIGK